MKKYNLNVKIINPLKKSSFVTYLHFTTGWSLTPLQLKQQILKQFGDKLVSSKLLDIQRCRHWSFGDTPSIWCHGVQSQMCDTSGDDIEEAPTKKPRRKKRKKMTCSEEKNDDVVSQL